MTTAARGSYKPSKAGAEAGVRYSVWFGRIIIAIRLSCQAVQRKHPAT
jgi:hypothetical protein